MTEEELVGLGEQPTADASDTESGNAVASAEGPSAPPARPSAAAIFGRLLDLYVANFVPLVVLSGVITVPALVLTWSLPNTTAGLANSLASIITEGALIVAFAGLQHGHRVPLGECLQAALGTTVRLVGVAFVLGIIIVVAGAAPFALGALVSPLFYVPGVALVVLLATRWGLASPAVMLEGKALNDAFRRSAGLTTPAWRLAAPIVIVANLFSVGSIAWAGAAALEGLPDITIVSVLAIVGVVLRPILPGATTLLFLALREAAEPAEHPARAVAVKAPKGSSVVFGTALTFLLVVGVSWAGIGFFGTIRNELANQGVVRFGSAPGADVCEIAGASDSFPAGTNVFWSAALKTTVKSGETVIIELKKDGASVLRSSKHLDSDAGCFGTTRPMLSLTEGVYSITILLGETVEATGTFSIR